MSDSDSDFSDYEDIRPYFVPSQWTELCSYERASYRSAKQNYHAMLQAGLAPKPPQFMSREPAAPKKRPARKPSSKSKRKRADSCEEGDENWTPDSEGKASSSRGKKKFVPPSRTKVLQPVEKQRTQTKTKAPVTVAQSSSAAAEQPLPQGPSAVAAQQAQQAQQVDETPVAEDGPAARYPKRAGSRKSYTGADGDSVQDDEELYCDDCEQSWEGDCPVHGPLQVIADTKVEAKHPQRALLTAPPQLAVLESKIKGAGRGVWTRVAVPRRVRFGPYEGDITAPNKESGYGWEIRRGGKPVHCVDALRESTSNWMRYVNCPRNAAEANLHPYQHRGALYYRTVCDIPANTELLVWYGNSYGKELGIDPKAFKAAPENPAALNGTFPCPACALCFVSPLLLSQHQRGGRCWGEIRRRRAAVASGGTPAEGPAAAAAPTATDADAGAGRGKKHCCTTCGAAFVKSSTLRTHERIHSGEKPFSCTTCGRAFSLMGNLKMHKRTHSGEKPFSCTTCGKAFSQSCHLRVHERTHSGEKRYSCTTCGAAFSVSSHLQRHERTHSGEKPFSCITCGKAFTNSSDLRRHELTHSGEKPFSCSTCGKAFTRAVHLTSHERTHSGEKPFSCSTCGKAFTRAGDLSEHERTHSGEKPFSCSTCGKAFTGAGDLRRHELTHSGEKPFSCSTCGKAFTGAGDLRRHELTHSGEKPFSCTACGKAFTRSHDLRRHERNLHAALRGPADAIDEPLGAVTSSTSTAAARPPSLTPLAREPMQAVQEAAVSSSCSSGAVQRRPGGRQGKENRSPAPRP